MYNAKDETEKREIVVTKHEINSSWEYGYQTLQEALDDVMKEYAKHDLTKIKDVVLRAEKNSVGKWDATIRWETTSLKT
jgi:hypothetical protein